MVFEKIPMVSGDFEKFLWFFIPMVLFFPMVFPKLPENSYDFSKFIKFLWFFAPQAKFLCISHYISNIFLNKIKHFEAKYF